MSDKNGRMDEEKEVKIPEDQEGQEVSENFDLEDILNEDSATGRKKLNLSFLEDENIYLSDEQEETTNENEEKIMEGKKKKKCFFKRLSKPKKIAFIVGMSILAIILIVGLVIGVKFLSLLNKINDGDDIAKMSTEYVDPNYDEILFDVGSEGYRQGLKDWATTGNNDHMYNPDVINVLLIGADSRDGTNTGNTDVMMIVSLNKRTKEIKLCSLLRDSYIYVEGINRSSCTKLNAAFSMGGADCLVKTVENNYKIEIDNYVMVNFESFARIIDAMGGIQLDITQAESDYIKRRFNVDIPVGENVTVMGEPALCYCRTRAIYASGDVKRTENQRIVIEAIMDKVKSASISDLNKYLEILLPEVYTGYKESEILSLGMEALTNGWAKYKRTQIEVPAADCRQAGDADMWIWVIDYQKAAHDLQLALYGESNITLEADRTTLIDLYNEGHNQSSDDDGDDTPPTTEGTTAPIVDVPVTNSDEDNDVEDVPVTEEESTEESTEEVTDETVPDEGGSGEDTTAEGGGDLGGDTGALVGGDGV